jgi:hypothetical protein
MRTQTIGHHRIKGDEIASENLFFSLKFMTRNSFSPISTSRFQFPAKRPAREELIPRDRVIYDSDDITLQQPSRIENQSIQPNETIQLGILRTA